MNDVEIRLGGQQMLLRPTFGAMREIEAQTGSSCETLYGLLVRRELHIGEAAKIVFYGLDAAGARPSDFEAVGNRLFEERISAQHIRDSLAEYLLALLWAPDEAKKKLAGEWRENEEITSRMSFPAPTESDGDLPTSGEQPPGNSGQSSESSVKERTRPAGKAKEKPVH